MVLFFSIILTVIKWSADKKKKQQQKILGTSFSYQNDFSIKTEALLKVEQLTQVKDESIKHFKKLKPTMSAMFLFFNDHNMIVVNYQ